MTKKKRIMIALDQQYIDILDMLCSRYKTKQYSKVIIILLNSLIIK